jgi:hypothetical protein
MKLEKDMTNMFKKSLVALALAGASAGAFAADIATGTTTLNVSTEYLQVAPAGVLESNAVVLELGAEYTLNDVITLTFTGNDALAVSSLPNFVTVAADDVAGLKGITVGLISTEVSGGTTKANYRVTDVTGGATDTTTGVALDLGTLDFDSVKVQNAGGVTVSFSAVTNNNLALDTSGGNLRSKSLFSITNQFVSSVNVVLDGVIDVEDDRFTFENGDTVDVLEIEAAQNGAFDEAALVDGVTFTISGNFSWVKDTDLVAAGIQPAVGVFTWVEGGAATCDVDSLTASALTISCDALDSVEITIDTAANGGDVALPAGTYSLATNVQYSLANAAPFFNKDLAAASAGAWTLNGSNTFIPYMPYSREDLSAISQIITVTNTGSNSGNITVDVTDESGNTTTLDLGINAAPGITRITGQLLDAMKAEGLLTGGAATKRFSLNVIVNDSAEVIQVYSAYNVNGNDRGWVQNDSVVTKHNVN